MASINISVPDRMREWVAARVESGRYQDAGDYLRDLIRRDQEEDRDREAIVAALVVGEESGTSERTLPDILAALKAESRDAGE